MSDKAKGILCLFVFIAFIGGWFQSCTHEHDWSDATCTEPRTCSSCKKTEGEPLGHKWGNATCLSPATCSVCGSTQGFRAEHTFVSATCTEPEKCSNCGKERHWYSAPLGHDWEEATCTTPKACSRCGITEGEPQHSFISYYWEATVDPTCQSEGEATQACRLCGEIATKVLPVITHMAGDWEVITEATPNSDGIKAHYCVWCGIEMGTLQYKYQAPSGVTGGSGIGGNNFNTYNNESQQNTTATYVLNTSTM